MMTSRTLRVAEVADRLSCSERTVRRWIADGTLQSVKVKALRLIPESALDQLIDAGDPAWLDDFGDASDGVETPVESTPSNAAFYAVSTPNSGEEE